MIFYTLAEDNGKDVTVFKANELQRLIRAIFSSDKNYYKNKDKIEKEIQTLADNGDILMYFSEIYDSASCVQKHFIQENGEFEQ